MPEAGGPPNAGAGLLREGSLFMADVSCVKPVVAAIRTNFTKFCSHDTTGELFTPGQNQAWLSKPLGGPKAEPPIWDSRAHGQQGFTV